MNKLLLVLLILCVWLSVNSCGKKDSPSTATSTTTGNSTETVFIYPYSTSAKDADVADSVVNTCHSTSSGYTYAPFYSTSTHDLKDRLPSSKWSNPVYSLQGHKISSSWENLWDGNIDMSLHQAEVIYDNYSTSSAASGGTGFWTGTKSDGTFSGNNCRDWSSSSSSDNVTWGSFLKMGSSLWIDNGTILCGGSSAYKKYFLCFMYN